MRRRAVAALAKLTAVACWTAVPLLLGVGSAEAACSGLTYAERQQDPRVDGNDLAEIIEDLSDPGCHSSAPWVGAAGLGGAAGLSWAGWAVYNYWAGGRPSAMVVPPPPQPRGAGAAPPVPPPVPPPAPPAAAEPPPEPGGRPGRSIRPADVRAAAQDRSGNPRVGDPVDPVTGEMTVVQTDVELPGALPLTLRRSHLSGYRAGTWFGPGWAATLDQRLELDEQGAVLTLDDGRLLVYPVPRPGRPVLPYEGARWPLTWDGGHDGAVRVEMPETGETMEFAPAAGRVGAGGSTVLPLTALSDRRGDRITFEYAADGAPRAVRHSGGHLVRVATGGGRVTALSLAGGGPDGDQVLVRFRYDAAGNLAEVVNSSGLPLRWSYDEAGRITGWTDRNGCWYRYEYDDQNRCVRATGPDGTLSAAFDYAPDGRTTVYTDALGHRRRYHYNSARQLTAEIDPSGAATSRTWDRHDRLRSVTDAGGATTRLDYDRAGRPVRVTYPDGRESRTEYDERGLPLIVTGPDGTVWRQSYDGRGNRTSVTDPAGATTRFTYDAAGHPAAVTDALGRTTRITCDAAGLPLTVTDAAGHTTTVTRDAFGRPVTVTDPLGAVTRLEWTVEGKPARRTAPDGTTESWTWDGEGNCTSHTDPNGGTTRFEHSHFDRLAARTGPDGARYEFAHDTGLRLTQVTNPQGLTWDYAYDQVGRLISETDFDGRTVTYAHDAAGRLTARTTPLGHRIRYEHDGLGRLVAKDADGVRTEYLYDAAGRPAGAASPTSSLTVERDILGRVLAETVDGRTTRYTYDAVGRRTSRTTPTGAVTELAYDAAGNRTALTASGHTLAFAHDALGRELERSFGAAGRPVTLATVFDALGRPTEQTLAAQGRPLRSRGYAYRPDSHLTSLTDHLTGTTRHFGLDPVGRPLTVTAEDWSETYAYDAAGNQTSAHWPDAAPHSEVRGERAYDGTRLTRAGHVRYTYDAAGRTVLRQKTRLSRKPETWRYEWDAEDRLVSCTTPDGTVWRYRYDPLGRRTAKQRMTADGETAEETLFTWDGTRLAEESNTATHTVLTWDHDGHRPLAQTERHLDPALPADQAETDRRFFAIVTDLAGTPTELVDEAGEIAWHTRTTLWGTTTWNRDATAYTPLRFPGQYADAETGLHYNYFRHYDPETGRYTTPDPLGLASAPNPVTYVHNPHTWTDPLGLAPDCGNGDVVTVYRKQTDHPLSQRIHIGDGGQVTITGNGKLYLNMSGDIRHTTEYRGDGGQIVAFDVPRAYRDAVRADALPQNKVDAVPDGSAFTRQEWKQLLKEYPEISDPTKGSDLYGIPNKLIDQLRNSIVPGSGRVVQEG